MRSRHRTLAALAAATLSVALLPVIGAPPSAARPATTASTIAWGDCADAFFVQIGLQCATVDVPLDHDRPGGPSVHLAVTRRAHTSSDADYQGVVLVNPGGPGGSGTIMPIISYFLPDDVAAAYDWIGWDPRGVGQSTPALSCDASYLDPVQPPYEPFAPGIEQTWLQRSAGYAASCGAAGGDLLRHVKTIDTVRDMDSLRVALGRDKINYYGYSYGTYLGQVYATQYPNRVRRMILDSNVQASRVWEKSNLDQNVGFEKVMQVWYGWMASYDSVYHLGSTAARVERTVLRTRARLAAHPLDGLGAAEFTDVLLNAGYYQPSWPGLSTALAALVNDGDSVPLLQGYSSGDDNFYAMYLATECTDAPWSRNWNVWRAESRASYRKAPFNTWGNAWYNAPCAFWPARAGRAPTVRGSASLPPILLIDQTLDGATPFQGSLEARRLFPTARLIAVLGGTSHATSPDGNPCVDPQIADYLRTGAIVDRKRGGGADTTCAALPQPVPDELAGPTPLRSSGVSSQVLQRAKMKAVLEALLHRA